MTHLTLLALGSRGDVLPCMVLGQGLKAAGFGLRIISTENFASMAAQYGLDFSAVPGDAEALLTSGGGVRLAESGQSVWKMWRSVKDLFWEMAMGISKVLSQPVVWQTDAIINQLPGGLYGFDLAEKLNIPMITAAVIPMLRTRAFPMVAFPSMLSFLPGYNQLSYRLAEQIVWSGFRKAINQWRQGVLGLEKRPFFGDFSHIMHMPTLLGFSEAVVPRPTDWGNHVHFTGYWFPEEPSWEPPPALVQFLETAPPPVFIGFGSMPVRDPQQITEIVLEALQLTEQRAVLQTGWAGIGHTTLPDSVYLLDYAPYRWLFPQMAAVVHHGGSGTTGFGFWAGVPTVLTPFLFDQFYWGERIQTLGIGPKPVPQKKLTAVRLAAALDTAVSDTTMRQRAAALGQKIQQEADGLATAVTVVKQILGE